jgi:hypothetical protein
MFLLSDMKKISALGMALTLLTACAAPKPTPVPRTSSIVYLPDSLVKAHIGDIEGLYQSWIAPLNTFKQVYIPLPSDSQLIASVAAAKDGFERFCSASGGATKHKVENHQNKYTCLASNGALIGEISTEIFVGNLLQVNMDSPQRIERRKEKLLSYQTRKSMSGPSGTIVTSEGKLKFIRIGNLKERDVLEVRMEKTGQYVPIEDVSKIEFHKVHTEPTVTLRDGRIETVNSGSIAFVPTPTPDGHRTPDSHVSYGGGKWGFPVVVIDPETGQPYIRVFSNFETIKSIYFDDPSDWKAKSANVIPNTFFPFALKKYNHELQREAAELYHEGAKDGWIKLMPDGKLPDQLAGFLLTELRRIANDPQCTNNPFSGGLFPGNSDIKVLVRCQTAEHERKLIFDDGYSLVTDVTPLSTSIVLNKIKSDIRR